MEHIVLHYLKERLDRIFHNCQHGFRKGMSCETQLCVTYHDLAKTMESRNTTHAMILDFKKAFDKVPHALLLEKLRQIPNLNPTITNWIQDLLTDRCQRVVIKGKYPSMVLVTSGVPQGSVLGPTLSFLYINDLRSAVSCKVSLYTYDMLLYQEVNTEPNFQRFQSNIDAVKDWSERWRMPFNSSKCSAISFGPNKQHQSNYTLGSSPIP